MAGASPKNSNQPTGSQMSPSVSAAVAAATEQGDALSSYKRKLFFRRLKVALVALIGLTLLLLGCLLGFVLPATLEVKGQERGNLSSTEVSSSLNRTASAANSSHIIASTSPSNATTLFTSTEPSNSSTITISSSVLLTVLTTMSPIINMQPAKDRHPSKWWVPFIHDSLSAEKGKRPFTEEPTTVAPNVSLNSSPSDDTKFSTKPVESTPSSSGSSNTVQKLWLLNFREHAENELQKKHNATIGTSMETARPNVRRVTSYPQQNITTTPPSVVTRHVRSTI